jgi:transposase
MNGVMMVKNRDLERIKIIHRLAIGQITQREAGKLLHVTDRQIRRLFKRYQESGDKGIISRKFGKSNRRLPEPVKDQALKLIAGLYSDFGPTLAAEKLQKIHNISLSVETVRQLMISRRLWIPNVPKPVKIHPSRARRSCTGELILIDGSIEFWFEDRGPKCVLLVFIDDATSCIGELFFTPTEDLMGYFHAMGRYLRKHGRPLAVYADRHAVFQVERKSPSAGEEHITQFERAMRELDIKLIHANSPQAKGRVERCNRTLQDRLIKELRLKGISDMETANLFAEQYRLEHNRNFGVPPAQTSNLHRPVEARHNLGRILKENHLRMIQKDLTFQYENEIYQVRWELGSPPLIGKTIAVWTDDTGHVHAEYKGKELAMDSLKQLEYHPVLTHESGKRWIMRKQRYKPNRLSPYKRFFKIR